MSNFQYGWIPQVYDQLKRRFATAAQGEKADSALQAASIGQSVEAHSDILTALAGLGDQTGLLQKTGDAAFGTFAQEATQILTAQIAQGRLTLASGDATPSADQLAKTTLYYTPYNGNYISLWDGSNWVAYPFVETSLSLSGLAANTNYDIFAYAVDDTLTLAAVAWSNSGAGTSTRASAISQRNGIWVETSSDRRYLGTIRTTGVAGQCEDSQTKRFVWNSQNRTKKAMQKTYSGSHTYTSSVIRYINNDPSFRLEAIAGLPTFLESRSVLNTRANNSGVIGRNGFVVTSATNGIGADATSEASDIMGIPVFFAVTDFNGYEFFAFGEQNKTEDVNASVVGEQVGIFRTGIEMFFDA